MMPKMTGIVPTFLVADVVTAAEHYRDAFGFSFDRFWGDPPQFVFVDRDSARIGLMQAPPERLRTAPTGFADATIHVDDIDGLAAELRARGARIVQEPVDNPVIAGRTMAVIDRDLVVISFVQPLS
jgi:predicted enzyme related to lactoylglutathione lyase